MQNLCLTGALMLYKDKSQAIQVRIDDLISRMTIEEKVKQLDMYSGNDLTFDGRLSLDKAEDIFQNISIGSLHDYYPESAEFSNEIQRYVMEKTRLGIPILFVEEALHGYQGVKGTAFPIPLGLASMWDIGLMEKIGDTVASEARSVGVHMVLSPVLGLAREPRWGRVQETYGEDPYLAAHNGVAFIKGLQKDDLTRDDAVVAEPKHFGVHSIPESGKNTAPVSIGEREARTNFLYVFEKAFKEAGALGAMAAYHECDGIPAASDPWLLKDLLRDEWGFKGMVIADLGAIARLKTAHYTASDDKTAISDSIRAGLDMQFYDFTHEIFQQSIIKAVHDGTLDISHVDRAVTSVLYVKFSLGLFDNPYTNPTLKAERYHCEKFQQLALEAAHKSIILLKNDNDILPLNNEIKKIAIIGELADKLLLGGYSPKNVNGVSLVEASNNSDFEIEFVSAGLPISSFEDIDSRFLQTEKGETGLKIEYFNNTKLDGEPALTGIEKRLSHYWHNLSPIAGISNNNYSIRLSGYIIPELDGDYEFALIADDYARVTIDGEEIINNWNKEAVNEWSHYSLFLQKGKHYNLKIEFAKLEDFAGFKFLWKIVPKLEERDSIFEKAVIAAKAADVVILVTGEKEEETGEGKDKQNLDLNVINKQLISNISETGTPIILVLQNGRPLVLTEEIDRVDAILETWYAGEFSGQAILDIITGRINPSGKLPITFPASNGQIPLYYNQKKSSIGSYVDGSNKPLFAFGFGLSYSTFEYSDLSIEKSAIKSDESQKISLKIENTSYIKGREIIQLYLIDEISSVVTTKMQLRGFRSVELEPFEEKRIVFSLLPEDLSLWNREMKRVVEPGTFKVQVGAASNDIRLEGKFEVY